MPNNRGVSNEEMLAMLHSSNKEQEAAMTEETVGPPAVAALPQVPEPGQEEQRPRRFAIGGQAVAEAHGTRWFQASRIDPPLNGFVPVRLWSIRNMVGDVLVPGANTAAISDMTPLDFFF